MPDRKMVTRSMAFRPDASARASSSRSRSRSGLYDSKVELFQYVSKVASNLLIKPGVATDESRTFHSTPSSSAARERFEEPTYAVSNSVCRRKSHALA